MAFAKLWKTLPKIPAGKAQRDFPAPRGHAPGRRDQGVGTPFPCPTAVADAKGRRALWAVGQGKIGELYCEPSVRLRGLACRLGRR